MKKISGRLVSFLLFLIYSHCTHFYLYRLTYLHGLIYSRSYVLTSKVLSSNLTYSSSS